jgi:F-type H+-transporting ATPase subunit alpha
MEEQVVVIYAGVNGFLDPLAVDRVKAFENGLLAHIRAKHADILETIRSTRDLGDDTAGKLRSAVEAFAKSFT